jgi:hypothetical protein
MRPVLERRLGSGDGVKGHECLNLGSLN